MPSRFTPVVALAVAVLIVWQQVVGLAWMQNRVVPLLPVGLWRAWIPMILLGLLVTAVSAIIARRRGSGTWALAGRVAGPVLALGPATVLAFQGRLVDPLFLWTYGLDVPTYTWPVVDVVLGTLLATALAATTARTLARTHRPTPA
ncbi:hypothetical protein WIS52_24110 [Pseudonocardia nematodicida]|uniref:Uncharacterized protein n=1 Tax=Pseudonocardia nematodicida TaxID=1206997 RepID=A0ABV1KGU8_9PSEU